MWKCKNCGEENEDTFDSCWNCSKSSDTNQSKDTGKFESPEEDDLRRRSMDNKLIENIKKNMKSKSTDDLEQILSKNDQNEYSDEAFEAIRQILEERRENQLAQQAQIKESRESDNKTANKEIANGETSSGYTTTYGTARMLAQFVSFIGWVVFVISLLMMAFSLIKSLGPDRGFALIGIFPAFAGAVSGLLLVMAGQMTRAIVDTADNTGEMLAVMKNKKWQ
jgi:lipopolysaccharide export LptBFGC system permease protein LptF